MKIENYGKNNYGKLPKSTFIDHLSVDFSSQY